MCSKCAQSGINLFQFESNISWFIWSGLSFFFPFKSVYTLHFRDSFKCIDSRHLNAKVVASREKGKRLPLQAGKKTFVRLLKKSDSCQPPCRTFCSCLSTFIKWTLNNFVQVFYVLKLIVFHDLLAIYVFFVLFIYIKNGEEALPSDN